MKKTTASFVKLDAPEFERIFEVVADDVSIAKVAAYEPELRAGGIVLPVEFTKTDGTQVTLGFTLDREHLRDIFDAFDYPDTIG